MATVTKDFKVKNGLIVEGTTATVNNFDVLTKKTDDQNYIVNLIGGTATSANEANKVVKRDANGDFSAGTVTADLVGDVTGNADTATALETSRTITLGGDLSGSVSFDGTANVTLTATVASSFATDAEVATAKSEAISDAAADATSKANAAQAAAISTAASDATTKANAAENAAKAYTDARETAITTAYQSYADTAESDAKAYADQKVADLVDSAPALLDTLNELAAAIGDDANFAANLATSVGEKVAKAGDTMTGALVLHADPVNNLEAATKAYVDTAASTAQSNAEDYADGLAGNYDPAGSASTALTNANSYTDTAISGVNTTINNLTTDDIAEGANEYFTDAKAKDSAAALLTTATLTNITITGTGNGGLVITAENGVADSTTADLAEDPNATGSSGTMYFTDARAVSALEAVTPDFPAVEIASVAKQVAASAEVATASTNTAVSWAKADYRSAEFLVKIANGSHTEVSKVILTLDTSDNIAITEYAMVGTNGDLGSVSADVSGNDVRLRVATLNNNSTVAVIGTLLK
ncbi:MAG: hypothetical protein ACK5P0_01255 [bacterium]|jgi:hypothetical protein